MADITNTDPELAAAAFEALASRVRDNDEGRPGMLRRELAHAGTLACDTCGQLPVDQRVSEWSELCYDAIAHVKETGHNVVVDLWRGAVYGPEQHP